ncbi:MAG: MTH938/NDUFAF3 family protein [Nitrospirota bacterium]
MKIEHYSFGKITIDGKTYTSDVIIYPGRVDSSWWRKEGHSLHIVDLTDIINAKPEILIIGTGYSGVMVVPRETLIYLESKGIEVHVERTGKAVELFNKLQKDKVVIAALHLTC